MAEAHVAKVVVRRSAERVEAPMHGLEFTRRSALEREDRLLLVSDRKDSAFDGARAGAGEEFGGQATDDFPLLRTRILRLVDQHVVDAAIELVVYPGGSILAEQRPRLVDQIVVVEEPAAVFRRLVAGNHGIGDGDQRRRAVAAGDGLAALHQRQEPRPFGLEPVGEQRSALLDRLGDQAIASAATSRCDCS